MTGRGSHVCRSHAIGGSSHTVVNTSVSSSGVYSTLACRHRLFYDYHCCVLNRHWIGQSIITKFIVNIILFESNIITTFDSANRPDAEPCQFVASPTLWPFIDSRGSYTVVVNPDVPTDTSLGLLPAGTACSIVPL